MGWLDGQVALVTGGGSGIGRAVVARFVEEGARVGIMERVASRAEQLRADLGDAVIDIAGDVSCLDDNRRAVAETVRAFGRLDVFVGNAGIFDVYASFADLSDDMLSQAYDELFGVNVKGCIFGRQSGVAGAAQDQRLDGVHRLCGRPQLGRRRRAVYRVEARSGRPHSRAGGTMTDLRGLASLGEDDRSQFANPGIEDRLRAGNPLRTVLTPDDLAGAYVFLASRRNARGITGSVMTVDAGAMLRMPRRTERAN